MVRSNISIPIDEDRRILKKVGFREDLSRPIGLQKFLSGNLTVGLTEIQLPITSITPLSIILIHHPDALVTGIIYAGWGKVTVGNGLPLPQGWSVVYGGEPDPVSGQTRMIDLRDLWFIADTAGMDMRWQLALP